MKNCLHILNVCPFNCNVVAGRGNVESVIRTSFEVVVTQTVRPKSVRNLCVIEHFDGVFELTLSPSLP